jgi:hypothetical protein
MWPLASYPKPRCRYMGVGMAAADRNQLELPAVEGALQLNELAEAEAPGPRFEQHRTIDGPVTQKGPTI